MNVTKESAASCVQRVDMRMKEDDDMLARRARDGDRDAFATLLERHYERIYRIGLRLLGDTDDAADLAQEVCIGLAQKVKSYRGDSRFTTWLYRVVVNAARDAMRRHAARRRVNESYAEISALVRAGRAAHEAQVGWLYEALAALSDELRETAVLVLQEGLSHAEAGAVLEVKESTISWRMHEMRKRLKKMAQAGEEGSS